MVVDAVDAGLHQFVQVADRGVEVHRRVEQQHALEVEAAAGFVQLADERGVQRAEAVAGEVELGDRQLVMPGANGLHDPIEILGIVGTDARCGIARGSGHEVVAGGRRQLHHVVAGAVEQPLECLGLARRVMRTGAGNDEDQRRRPALACQAIAQLFDRPEVVRQGEFALRPQTQAVVSLVDGVVAGYLGAQCARRAGDGRFERIGQGVAILLDAEISRVQRRNDQGEQGGQAQQQLHGVSPLTGHRGL